MAEAVSDSEAVKPPPKRRRIVNLTTVVPVPVYSNKVSRSLQLKPAAATLSKTDSTDDAADGILLRSQFPMCPAAAAITLSDSEEDDAGCVEATMQPDAARCPSPPPPPESPDQKQSRQVRRKISEINRKLRAVTSLLSPEPQRVKARTHVSLSPPYNDDLIIMSPEISGVQDSPYCSTVREIPLKIRCRTDVHKIAVLSSTPLSDVVAQLAAILNVPPARLLLMREEVELPTDSTISALGLGITDIIECVVMAAEDGSEGGSVTLRLQSKERESSQEFTLHRDAPLGSIFSQYLSRMSSRDQKSVRFHFDGVKVTHCQTPAQLDMEDGDIIEVWT